MKNVKKNNLFLIVLFAAIVLGCKNSQKDAAQTNTMPEAIPEVDTMSLKTQYFQKQILCNGHLRPIQKIDLTLPQSGGFVTSIKVRNGQRVSAGTVLAEMDSRDKVLDLNKAKNDLERAKIELQDKLIGLGYNGDEEKIPADILRRAEILSGFTTAKHAVSAAQSALSCCKLIAPFSGRISNLEIKAYHPGDKLCTLIDDRYFDVEFSVLEAELKFIHIGTYVNVQPYIDEQKNFTGQVTDINPSVDDNGLVRINARIKNSSPILMDGMNMKIAVENNIGKALVVPKKAVVERDGYNVIFLYDKKTKRAIWTYIDIIYENLDSYAITGNAKKETHIKEGDVVITSGNLNLADATLVKVTESSID